MSKILFFFACTILNLTAVNLSCVPRNGMVKELHEAGKQVHEKIKRNRTESIEIQSLSESKYVQMSLALYLYYILYCLIQSLPYLSMKRLIKKKPNDHDLTAVSNNDILIQFYL